MPCFTYHSMSPKSTLCNTIFTIIMSSVSVATTPRHAEEKDAVLEKVTRQLNKVSDFDDLALCKQRLGILGSGLCLGLNFFFFRRVSLFMRTAISL
jgi:hypothetical protein